MAERSGSRVHERWARLRFAVIGALLAAPPAIRCPDQGQAWRAAKDPGKLQEGRDG